jgi:hypothetical protein
MLHVHEWIPTGGWNKSFSEQDKIQYTHLFLFFKENGFIENIAEIYTYMILFKQKYGITYSEEQEEQIKQVLLTRK